MKPLKAPIPLPAPMTGGTWSGRRGSRFALFLLLLGAGSVVLAHTSDETSATWLQWGGPSGEFRAPTQNLSVNWPNGGPEQLWSREIGEAYSAILFEDGRLYTMARAGDQESAICLDAVTGETVWERVYKHTSYEGQRGYGVGPRSTPLIAGDRLFTIGMTGKLMAMNKADGTVLWSQELWGDDFRGNHLEHGYSSSPVAYGDSVIVSVGGEEASLVAFDQKTGSVKWQALSFRNSYSSPRIVQLAGELQLLVFMAEELIGVDPETGVLRWRYEHGNQWDHNISMPLVVDQDTIFLSSPQAGARGLRLSRIGEAIEVEELWLARRVQLYHGSAVRSGDWVYGSTGVTSPAFMTAVNIRTGEIGWRRRGFAKANLVAAGGKLVILDEDGVLYLASATPEELVVHASTQLLDRVAWTAPTIVGEILYVRDKQRILAIDLG